MERWFRVQAHPWVLSLPPETHAAHCGLSRNGYPKKRVFLVLCLLYIANCGHLGYQNVAKKFFMLQRKFWILSIGQIFLGLVPTILCGVMDLYFNALILAWISENVVDSSKDFETAVRDFDLNPCACESWGIGVSDAQGFASISYTPAVLMAINVP